MPRIKPTTAWGNRTLPTTLLRNTRIGDCTTWNEATFTWDSATYSWNDSCEWINAPLYIPRTKLSTEYNTWRTVVRLSWDQATFTWNSTLLTWDETSQWSLTDYSTPRYALYVEDLTLQNVFDLWWNEVLWISGSRTNKIDTIYT